MSGTGSSFVKRSLKASYTLGSDTFDGVQDTIILAGLRMRATIAKPGGVSQGALQLRVHGLTLDHMNKMAQLGSAPTAVNKYNTVTVMAGSGENPSQVVYNGFVTNAVHDMQGSPDTAFNILAFGAAAPAVQVIPPSSYQGGGDAADILKRLAGQMGLKFENNGVTVKLSNAYFPGSAYTQAELCAEAAGINMAVDDGTLTVWPKGGGRGSSTDGVPLVSKDTGMVGYPVASQIGVDVTTLFNPAIRFGGFIEVDSILPFACGKWQVFGMHHDLACEEPGGPWFSRLNCIRPGYL